MSQPGAAPPPTRSSEPPAWLAIAANGLVLAGDALGCLCWLGATLFFGAMGTNSGPQARNEALLELTFIAFLPLMVSVVLAVTGLVFARKSRIWRSLIFAAAATVTGLIPNVVVYLSM